MTVMRTATAMVAAIVVAAIRLGAQQPAAQPKGEAMQVVDTEFTARIPNPPTFARGHGPVVLVDAGHQNFHTADGRYRPFAKLLETDGYTVRSTTGRLDAAALAGARVVVIANALSPRNQRAADWRLPAYSAFDSSEIAAIATWVRGGGSLLLIADHMPFPGAVADLASALGVGLANGYALLGSEDPKTGDYPITFRRRDGTLLPHAITNGRSARERIDSIVSFTGTAFWLAGAGGHGLMALPAGTRLMLPVVAWQFTDTTPSMSARGLLQGGAVELGRGRVAMFGEAAMFSAQRKGAERVPMGMNAPEAHQNLQFTLNVLHWLSRTLE